MNRNESNNIIKIRSDLPKTLWLVLGYACNSNCYHCYAKKNRKNEFVSDSVIATIKKMAIFIERIILIGGEPTLYPKLFNLIAELKKYVGEVIIITNGKKLIQRSYVKDLVSTGVSTINISIGNENNKNVYKDQKKAIKNTIEIMGYHDVSAVLTIGYQDIDYFIKIIKEYNQSGLRYLAVNFYMPTISNPADADKFATPFSQLPLKTEELYREIISHTEIKPTFYLNLPLCIFNTDFLKEIFSSGHAVTGCHIITGGGIVIDPSGNLLPCTHWIDCYEKNIFELENEIGNIDKFKNFWKYGSPLNISQSLGVYRSDKCIDCKYWAIVCVGGCPLLWLNYNPDEIIQGRIYESTSNTSKY